VANEWGAYFRQQTQPTAPNWGAYFPTQKNPYNDEGESWAEQPTETPWSEVGAKALQNAPQSLLGAAKTASNMVNPFAGVQAGLEIAKDPKAAASGTLEHYKKYTSVPGVKQLISEDPFGTALEVGSAFAGGRIAPKAIAPKPKTAMPRGSVREGDELLKTGGARMNEAKLNPAKVDAADISAPMQKFREKLRTEAAIELDPQFVPAALMNRINRIESAYKPTQPGAMSKITKVNPSGKPPISLSELHGHRKSLDTFVNSTGKTEGRLNEQGYIALELKKAVDEIIDIHPESGKFKIGTHEYHRGAMNRDLEEMLQKAQDRRQWKNGDEAGALSAEISRFLGNKKNRYKFTPQARQQLRRLSQDKQGQIVGGFSTNSSFGGNVFARAVETAVGLPPFAGALIGNPIRQSRNARIIDEFKRIQEQIRAGGPVR
jgi:hypothetical protein